MLYRTGILSDIFLSYLSDNELLKLIVYRHLKGIIENILEVAGYIYAGRRDDENVMGNLLQIPGYGLTGTTGEVNDSLSDVYIQPLQIQHYGAVG